MTKLAVLMVRSGNPIRLIIRLYEQIGFPRGTSVQVKNMKWVTRAGANVDRIACPWLIKKFVDSQAEFLYVPTEMVKEVAQREGAIPFDAKDIELGHYQEDGVEHVSFDAIIKKYQLKDPALLELAKIVRGADAKVPHEPPPESAGLKAVAAGFKRMAQDDPDNLARQFPTYNALYLHCLFKVQQQQQAAKT